MDASAVLTLIQTFLQVLDSPISREIESVWGYKSQLQKLRDTISTIKALFLDAENLEKQQCLSNILKNKLQRLQEAVYQADDLFDEVATVALRKKLMSGNKVCTEVRLFFSRFNQLYSAFKLSREIREIRGMLDGIKNDHNIHGFGSIQPNDMEVRYNSRETHSFVCEEDVIIGRDEDKWKVIEMLVDDTVTVEEVVSVVSIVGIGGLGKTTLAQLVYNDDRIQREFQLKMWVCVSDDFDVKLLLRKILAEATKNTIDSGLSLEQLQINLRKELQGNKYLLVLDDIWNEDSDTWNQLRILLTEGRRGSRILVTTRSMRVATTVGSDHAHTHDLKGLSKEDSWKLFKKLTLEPGQHLTEPQFLEIGDGIILKCVNVPLALRVIGSLLKGQGENTWRNLAKRDLSKIAQDKDVSIIPVLKISYNYLPPCLKSCFSYCAVFPKDYQIMKEDLICLWMAQGFIMPLNGQSFEDLGEEYFINLLQRCFFQDVKQDDVTGVIISCKMHDLVHDLAKEVAGSRIKCESNDIISFSNDKTHHICIDEEMARTKNVGCYLSEMKRLRTCLACPSTTLCSYNWLPKMIYLRVLDLSAADFKLPSTINQLVHLRYLDLSGNCKLCKLPNSITQLCNLQTLKLERCWYLKELPRELSKLVNLRLLDIWDCDWLRRMPPGMNRMTCLHKLTRFVVGGCNNGRCFGSVDAGKLGDLKYLDNHTDKIQIKMGEGWRYDGEEVKEGGYLINKPLLNEIEISWDNNECVDDYNAEALLQGLQPHCNVRKLRLNKYPGVKFPSWGQGDSLTMNLSNPLPKLVKLKLEKCTRLKHVPLLRQLRHLKVLRLDGLSELEYVESNGSGEGARQEDDDDKDWVFFPSLERLELWNLPKLKGWWKAASQSQSGEGKIEIQGTSNNTCEQLLLQQQESSLSSIIVAFPRLSHLQIKWCPYLTAFPSLPNVKTLTLWNDDEIERLSRVEMFRSGRLSSLRSLDLAYCRKLKSVSERGVWEHFTALETLVLWRLEELEMEDNDKQQGNDDDATDRDMPWRCIAPSLSTLELIRLPKMVQLPRGMRHLTALQVLHIGYCKNMEEIPGWISCLTSLHRLSIHYCPKVKSVPEQMRHLTSLKQLHLIECSAELKERCHERTGADWHIIQHIPDIKSY